MDFPPPRIATVGGRKLAYEEVAPEARAATVLSGAPQAAPPRTALRRAA